MLHEQIQPQLNMATTFTKLLNHSTDGIQNNSAIAIVFVANPTSTWKFHIMSEMLIFRAIEYEQPLRIYEAST